MKKDTFVTGTRNPPNIFHINLCWIINVSRLTTFTLFYFSNFGNFFKLITCANKKFKKFTAVAMDEFGCVK